MTERIELFERGKKHKERITSLIKEEFSNQNKSIKENFVKVKSQLSASTRTSHS
jgi:hypothetical protein